ncbi:MAG: ParB/RepB/Spo0J family partition protein [Bryobacteraceae bacterium]|nr:ParB/RepB/Spo0J family partition protein [Bryobacteraceae bacterium]
MARLAEQSFELVAVERLRCHPANPRKGDLAAIGASIQANGFYGAVVAQRSTGYVLAGNHRLEAARREGLAEIPVAWLEVDDATALRILAVDNRTNDLAGYDEAALAELLQQIERMGSWRHPDTTSGRIGRRWPRLGSQRRRQASRRRWPRHGRRKCGKSGRRRPGNCG